MSGEQRQWWIGATDVASEGVWWWPHSHRLVDFTAWGLGEPNKKQTENYSLFFLEKATNGLIFDMMGHQFILYVRKCEITIQI